MNITNNFILVPGVSYDYGSYTCKGCYSCGTGLCTDLFYDSVWVEIDPKALLKYFTQGVEKAEVSYLINKSLKNFGMYDGDNYRAMITNTYFEGQKIYEIVFEGDWEEFHKTYKELRKFDLISGDSITVGDNFKRLLSLSTHTID